MDKASAEVLTGFRLNGRTVEAAAGPGERLSHALRERLGARDVKVGCDAGDCGACTVLLDGLPVCACLTPARGVAGRAVETLAGLADDPAAARLRDAFQSHHAAQCGICTPGMIVAATALLRATPAPTAAQVQDALAGVLCRCTGYRRIIDAVVAAGAAGPVATAGAGTALGLAPAGQGGPAPRPAGSVDLLAAAERQGAGAPKASSTAEGARPRADRAEATPRPAAHVAQAPGAIGTSLPRIDGAAKVEGREAFGDDVAPVGALVVVAIRSPHAHAGFAFGDLAAAAARPGVEAVLTAADVPGLNAFGVIPGFTDQPVFAEGRTRFRGEAVAAVVGTAEAMAAFDPASFPVTWKPCPALSSVSEALAEGAPLLHAGAEGNVMCRGHVRRGDAEAALARAPVTVEGAFETGFVEHAPIEPEAGCAEVVGGRVVVHACTQAPAMDRDALADVLGVEPSRIRIVPTAVGGGFGTKLDLSVQPFLAIAALKTGRPVRMAYSRTESMQATTKRHPSRIRMRIGASRDGTIEGMTFEGDFDTGAYASWGPTVANRVPIHASGPYAVPHYHARSRAVHTHRVPSGAFRGFGVPQSAIAGESLLDELAERLGIDPLELRLRNALRDGTPTVCGQIFTQGVGIAACLDALRPAWEAARVERVSDGPLRRGAGIASGWYGCGNTSLPNPSTIRAGLRPDGALVLHQGAVDIGQGSSTVIAQIFAGAFGVPVSALTLVGADTDLTPDAGKTSASRQTFVSGNAAKRAGEALRAQVLLRANASEAAVIALGAGRVTVADAGRRQEIALADLPTDPHGHAMAAEETYDPPIAPLDADGQGAPYAQFGYAAHLAVVEVDVPLGTVRVLRIVAAHDVGRAINPGLIEGQVQGGVAQGLGMALMEEFVPHRTENLHDYLIPTIGDVPPVETLIVEEPDAHGPFGAKGLGEHALIPTAPAILNAIRHATGARIRRVPATPDVVRAALREAGHA